MGVITQAAATAGQMFAWLDQQRQVFARGMGGMSGSIPGRASGGYASGIIRTGEEGREFVLDAQTTRAAEQMVGGALTQKNVLGGGSGGVGGVNVNQNYTFHGDMSAGMKKWFRSIARQEAVSAFAEVMG